MAYFSTTSRRERGCGGDAKALDAAQLQASDIDYLNLHGTSTPQNDAMEMKAVQTVFSDAAVALSSTKHKTGHCLGAAGAIEAFVASRFYWINLGCRCIMQANWTMLWLGKMCLPHLNTPIRYAMSNSFAFGGSNISLIFRTALP
jgi:3-oxoacyl-[acyl-carrier-protein] synthase-1